MEQREAELRDVFGEGLLEAVRDEHALRLELRDAPGLRERLERLIELERACCPFLELELEREHRRLVLRIDGPPEAGPVIDGFHELAADARLQ